MLGNMCIAFIYLPVDDVINFEINFNPNKAKLFGETFLGEGEFDPILIFQKELI